MIKLCVLNILLQLDSCSTEGPNNTPGQVQRELAFLVPMLTHLFSNLFMPQQWKSALVTLPFHKGKRSDPLNDRLISLTSINSL